MRFLERCTPPPEDADVPTRGEVMRQLALLTLTENERVLMDRGLKTRRQVLEETFWYKFAYHCFREFGSNGCTLLPAVDESSGAFMVAGVSEKRIYTDRPKLLFFYYICQLDFEPMPWIRFIPESHWPIYLTQTEYGLAMGRRNMCFDCREEGGTLTPPDFWEE